MELDVGPEDRAFREELRAWLAVHAPPPMPTEIGPALRARDLAWQRSLYEAGYAGISWPREYGGRGLSLTQQMIWYEETARRGISHVNSLFVGLSHAGPTLIACGTDEQKARWLPPILRGETVWCQGFSEPNAGSDLASLQTRAELDGDDLVLNGVKIWTSYAQVADQQEMLVRTNPEVPKHKGITWLVCDMDQPGIEIRPLRTLVRESHFCEVHYHDARVPLANVVGAIDDGWRVARATLAYEHGVANLGQQIRLAQTMERIVEAARERAVDEEVWSRVADARAEVAALRAMAYTMISRISRERLPGPEGSLVKLFYGDVSQRVHALGIDVLGVDGMRFFADDQALSYGYLASLAATIGGGTSEVQRNIVAERLLGLPGDALMDLLPGPLEDAAVARVRPFLNRYFGVDHWTERLRTAAPLPAALHDDAIDAGLFSAPSITAEAQVAVELGHSLAPVGFLASLIAPASGPAAMAAPRTGGGYARFGPLGADVTVVWNDDGIRIADGGAVGQVVECIDPTTPMSLVDIGSSRATPHDVETRAALLIAAVHAGLARGACAMAVEYARTRTQFDRPIGANQAIKHLCADAATRSEAAWASLLYASVSLAEARADARFQIAVASRVASDAAHRNARVNIQVHGGRGYTFECPAHLFLMRAQILDQASGGTRRARRILLDERPLGSTAGVVDNPS